MTKGISNTSPLLYLYRSEAIKWLPKLFDEIWKPDAVKSELLAGRGKGYDVPNPTDFTWLQIINPKSMPTATEIKSSRCVPSKKLSMTIRSDSCWH